MREFIVFAFVCIAHGPVLAMATEWFGVHLPCVTLFTVTFHWMTLLIFSLLCCCCCSPCCIIGAAFALQKGKKGSDASGPQLAWEPPENEEQEGLMKGYGDVFPQELRRMNERGSGRREPPEIRPYLFCCIFFILGLCLLIAPMAYWTSYKLYNQIMMELFYFSPVWMWALILILSFMAACTGIPAFCLRSDGPVKKLSIYCPACLGCLVFILCIWGFGTAPFSKPYVARTGNEICQDFDSVDRRPAICGPLSTAASPTPAPARLLFRAEDSSDTHRASADIDLDEDGLPGPSWLATPLRRLDPSHDAATSYLQTLLAGGSYCVDTSSHSAAWTAPTYEMKAHDAASSYLNQTTTERGCKRTEELCENGSPAPVFNEQTSCTCNGKSVAGDNGLVGGHCNLWDFGDPGAWCFVNSGVQNCGALVEYKGLTRSEGPCLSSWTGSQVVMRSKALEVGYRQYLTVLIVGVLLALISCIMGCCAFAANKHAKPKRYHEDNSLPWLELVIVKPNNAICWQVLGWDQVSWDGDDPKLYPRSEGKSWNQLGQVPGGPYNCSEMQAASFLGFTPQSWEDCEEEAEEYAERGGAAAWQQQEELVDTQLADQFYAWNEEASKRITLATPERKRLEVYGFYHQARQGNISGMRPSGNDPDEQKKYDAWYRVMGMPRSVAMREYINAVKELR